MPYNYDPQKNRLHACDQDLDNLFLDLQNAELKLKINAVKKYYNDSYVKAVNEKTEEIADRYELFIQQLTQIKAGTLDSTVALDTIGKSCDTRKLNILFYDLAKVCEALLYASTAISLYPAIMLVALPILLSPMPFFGVTIGITMATALVTATHKALSCFGELRSCIRHDREYTNELALITFFTPKHLMPPVAVVDAGNKQTDSTYSYFGVDSINCPK